MKYLHLLFLVVILSSVMIAQEEIKKNNPYPEFVPYKNVETNLAQMDESTISDVGKEQPARWLSVDPLADKYPGWSPYNYAACNPLLYIDPNGDSIQVAGLRPQQQTNIISDLVSITGIPMYINSSGKLVPTPTFTYGGKTYQLASAYGSGGSSTSSTAANFLSDAMSNQTTVNAITTSVVGSQAGGQLIKMNSAQIEQFISGTPSSLDSRTMGYGMNFMHELSHTVLGQSFYGSNSPLIDQDGSQMGQVVPKMNVIRTELGNSFGQRTQYAAPALGIGNSHYIPFGNQRITFRKIWK